MYHKAYGIIKTLAPLHIGASAGEETGNLNLIFRDQFTQTGIIPGSSIRGRFRADMRYKRQQWLEQQLKNHGIEVPPSSQLKIEVVDNDKTKDLARLAWLERKASDEEIEAPKDLNENFWYGHQAIQGQEDGGTTEALVKFEYASLLWLPVFCPGQPIVWVSCPRLLKRYQQITGQPRDQQIPKPTGNPKKHPVTLREHCDRLFFNLGFLDNLTPTPELSHWVPQAAQMQPDNLVVIDDNDISIIHDMALYRQTRTKLENEVKKVENFFGFEALPEDSILVFPVAVKETVSKFDSNSSDEASCKEQWRPFKTRKTKELYFGGLESIGCGRCEVTLAGEYFETSSEEEN